MELQIVPGQSVGPVRFGSCIQGLTELLELQEDEGDYDGKDRWNWYSTVSRDLLLQTCNDVVVTVICERQCSYRSRHLVGLPESELRKLFADKTIVEGDVPELGTVLEVPELGLQFGLESGCVESATVGVDPDDVLEEPQRAT